MRINSAPYRSSNLAISPSHFSPRLPIINISCASSAKRLSSCCSKEKRKPTSPPPQPPLQWLWQCHICKATYPLGVTRRCLVDGHYFCSGVSYVKPKRSSPLKVAKRGKACPSEFDYKGWKTWGDWRRSEQLQAAVEHQTIPQAMSPGPKNCWETCDFPSECRWGKRFGVQFTPTAGATPTARQKSSHLASEPPLPSPPAPGVAAPPPSPEQAEAPSTIESMLNKTFVLPQSTSKSFFRNGEGGDHEYSKEEFWSALMASAKRRKSSLDVSPLHEYITAFRAEKAKHVRFGVGTDGTEKERGDNGSTVAGSGPDGRGQDSMEGVEYTGRSEIKRGSGRGLGSRGFGKRASIRNLFPGRGVH